MPQPLATCLLTFLSPAQHFRDTPLGTTPSWDPCLLRPCRKVQPPCAVHPGCDLTLLYPRPGPGAQLALWRRLTCLHSRSHSESPVP